MKRFILILVAALVIALGADARTYALLIGVSQYANSANNLPGTGDSAKKMAQLLKNHTKDVSILTSKYANTDNIKSKLTAIANRAQAGDRIIFYFSGHGGEGGLATYDNWLSYNDIVAILGKSKAKDKYCFIDACRAGSAAQSRPNSGDVQNANITFFVSSRANENSAVAPLLGDVFTQSLIKGLQGKCDADANRKITVVELFKYIYNDVVARPGINQHPQLIGPKSMHDNVILEWK